MKLNELFGRHVMFFVIICLSFGYIAKAGVTIMGRSVCTREQMERFLLKNNPKAKAYVYLIPIFLEEGQAEGVRGDLAFAQSLKETGFFKFGNDVHPGQNNFAGLGAVGGHACGCSFKTAREGVRAQIQHLKAYGSTRALNFPCVDPRFNMPKRRCAVCFEDLGGRWACPGYDTKKFNSLEAAKRVKASYGDDIVRLWNEMKKMKRTRTRFRSNTF